MVNPESLLGFGLVLALGALAGCPAGGEPADDWAAERAEMVRQLRTYGIRDEALLRAMAAVRRHRFIPEPFRNRRTAYGDHPCSIGHDQTISQPYIVAYMTAALAPRAGDKILEIGTGSGYQAAVLAELGAEVFTIELIPELGEHARAALAAEGYGRVRVRIGDGYQGWPEHAPFDAIIVTCAPEAVPPALVEQLRDGGRMIVPVGPVHGPQRLVILRKSGGQIHAEDDLPVRFVPMVRPVTSEP
jgi:protein-L-isoaspartate(D-aspartate) O-methyltransferase